MAPLLLKFKLAVEFRGRRLVPHLRHGGVETSEKLRKRRQPIIKGSSSREVYGRRGTFTDGRFLVESTEGWWSSTLLEFASVGSG